MNESSIFIALGVLALYWAQFLYQLQVEWSANDQYAFGWFVPLIAAGLFWMRWREGGQVELPKSEETSSRHVGISTCSTGLRSEASVMGTAVLGGLLLLAVLPLRVVEEANTGWRSAQWAHALVLVLMSFLVLWRLGRWPCLRQFGFPVLFLLVAVPWPSMLEGPLVRHLKWLAVRLTVDVLGALGLPAVPRGNLIEISSGVLSVDTACSGVRSLQTSFMIAILLGELFRLCFWRRVVLLPTALVVALAANVGRTTFLTWSAARQGFARMEFWHGPAGIAVVIVVLVAISVVAVWLARSERVSDNKAQGSGQWPEGSGQRAEIGGESGAVTDGRGGPRVGGAQPGIRMAWLVVALIWLVFTEAATGLWFRAGDSRAVSSPPWSIRWPTNATGYQELGLRKVEHTELRYDEAKNASWQDETGNLWSLISLRWGPGNKHSFIGRGHPPDECFVAAGWRLRAQPDPVRLTLHGVDLPFRRYTFLVDGRTAHVFMTLWDDRSPGGRQELPLAYGIGRRLKAAVQGKRHHGLKKLEISIIGPATSEEALSLLQKELEKMIFVEKPTAERGPGTAGERRTEG